MNEGNKDIPYQSLLKIFLAEKTEEKLHGMTNRSFFAEFEVGMVFIISADLYSLQVKVSTLEVFTSYQVPPEPRTSCFGIIVVISTHTLKEWNIYSSKQ